MESCLDTSVVNENETEEELEEHLKLMNQLLEKANPVPEISVLEIEKELDIETELDIERELDIEKKLYIDTISKMI